MLARDIMTRTVVTVTVTTSISEAATLLAARGFTALPVVDGDGALFGLLTEADILRDRFPRDPRFHCSDEGSIQRPDTREPAATVGGVMTAPPPSVREGADVVDLVTIMRVDGLRSMPVIDGRRLVGVVSRRDLVRTLTRDDLAVATDVLNQLETYGGHGRWTVEAIGVIITDALENKTDRHVATVPAEAVRGVTVVHMADEGAQR